MIPLPTYRMVRWLFPRLLGVIYLISFLSWGVQYRGLVGRDGVVPAARLIEQVHAAEKERGEFLLPDFPTLQYFNGSDEFALTLIGICSLFAVLVVAGVAQRWLLLALWLGYLSLSVTGDVFLSFQWDALLLEAGLLAVWLAPGRWWSGRLPPAPPRGSVFLLHWLIFRLMLLSGVVKYWSGDSVWRDMTALAYHYETQPLPHVLSWYMHQLPRDFHIASCWVMYGIELVLPFGVFMGRWGRGAACAGFSAIMAVVFLTGNYNFFNLLTAALAVTLLDDSWWPGWLYSRLGGGLTDPASRHRPEWVTHLSRLGPCVAVAVVVGLTTIAADASLAGRRIGQYAGYVPASVRERVYGPVAPLRSFNAYGLFQDMTVERPEIIIEVSGDGIQWSPLEFKWKPGDLRRAPGWVAPHQPRLDWQMWFAALYPGFDPRRDGPGSGNAWFGEFLAALLQQKQPVWDLLEPPRLPQAEVRHIRARLWRYQFTDAKARAESGAWWRREFLGTYSPTFSVRAAGE